METQLPDYNFTPLYTQPPLARDVSVRDHDPSGLDPMPVTDTPVVEDTFEGPVVRLNNYSNQRYSGWLRVNVDDLELVDGSEHFVGERTSLDTRAVDVYVSIDGGTTQHVHLHGGDEPIVMRPELPSNPLQYLGGLPTCGGKLMTLVDLKQDGVAIIAHFRARFGRTFVADLHLQWFADQPWMTGELIVTSSNPEVPDITETAPEMPISFGNSVILHRGSGDPVTHLGGRYCDGQARVYPIVLAWLGKFGPTDYRNFGVVASFGLGAVGVSQLLHDGNPNYPAQFDAPQWAAQRLSEAVRRSLTWEPPAVGPASNSTVTGAQEDQVFVRGEALLPGGVGGEWVTYLSALKLAHRPCHMLMADGSPWDVETHAGPRAVMWDGRFHWHTGVSPYQHGKPRQPTAAELTREGTPWFGYDVEHALFATLAAGARYTGSMGCQFLLEQVARTYLAQYTTTPGWSTSGPNASRAVGWEGIMAVHLWRELKDRRLARRVKNHYRERVSVVIVPALRGKTWWDTRVGDERVWDDSMQGQTGPWQEWAWAMPWQQSIGAYGLELGCRVLGADPEGIVIAVAAARVCVERDWLKLPGETRYRNIGNQPAVLENRSNMTAAWFDARPRWFETTWAVPAVDVMRRYAPEDERTAELWAQIKDDVRNGRQSWVPPEAPVAVET